MVIRHSLLEGDNSGLMAFDGVHLNHIDDNIFLSGLQDGIKQALVLLGGGQTPL